MTLDQLLALFPDNTSGQITAADLRSFASAVALLANNLSDLQSAEAARTNLGLGTAAVADADAFDAAGAASSVDAALSTHVANTSNPHAVTAAQVGLGSVNDVASATAATPGSNAQRDSEGGLTAVAYHGSGAELTDLPLNAAGSPGAVQYSGGSALVGAGWKFVGTAGSERLLGPGVTDDGSTGFQINDSIWIANNHPLYFSDANCYIQEFFPSSLYIKGSLGITCFSYGHFAISLQNDGSSFDTGMRSENTSTAAVVETVGLQSFGTPGAGFGATKVYSLDSSTNTQRPAAGVTIAWVNATDALYAGSYTINVYTSYSGGPIAGLTISADPVAEGYSPSVRSARNTLDDGTGASTWAQLANFQNGAQSIFLQLVPGGLPSASPSTGMMVWNSSATSGQELQVYGTDGNWHYIPYV